jgi:hypothetical protein
MSVRCALGSFAVALAMLAGFTWQARAAEGDFKAGAGMRVITPNPLLPVSGGLGPTQPARGKRGELTVRALVVQRSGITVGIVQVDALGFPSVLGDRISARVPRIPRKNLLIGSTHTHSAPCCYAFPDGLGGHTGDLAYIDAVCVKVAEALNEALDKLQPAKLKIATGEAKGKIAYNYYAPDLYDRRMSVIQAIKPDGSTIATLVNYAVHPEVLGAGVGLISPDLVGPLCDRIEAQAGGMAMFMNGAQGGMITADNRDLNNPSDPARARWNDMRTWDECVRIGELMASEALRIVGLAKVQENPELLCESQEVKFPVESPAMWFVVQYSPLKYPHTDDKTITSRINIVNLGNAQILTIPGEALPNIGFYLKRKMRGEHNLLFGLTNDAFGYIMTKVDYNSFPRYDYISRTSMGEMTGEILIEQSLGLVAKTPEPGAASAPPAASGEQKNTARVIKIDGQLDDWAGVRSYTDQEGDTHDTDHKLADDKPNPVDHPDADLVEYRVAHDAENLYFYVRSRGQVGRTQKAVGDKQAGRYYLAITIDVDDNDETGYWIHEGGYYPSTRGYDVNAEVEYYDGELNTVCYLNHGALDAKELQQAFLDQSSGKYREGHDGPYPAGFMRVLPGKYKQYTQWVYHDNGEITFVRDKGPVVPGIGKAAISKDGHVIEVAFPYKGFLVNERGQPIMALGKKIDISVSLEASGELAPGGDWASDTGDPINGYLLTP